jgi:hypothetical protein
VGEEEGRRKPENSGFGGRETLEKAADGGVLADGHERTALVARKKADMEG